MKFVESKLKLPTIAGKKTPIKFIPYAPNRDNKPTLARPNSDHSHLKSRGNPT